MGNKNRFRLVLSAFAIALLGTACDAKSVHEGNECFIDADYQITCPVTDPGLGIKSN